MTTEQKSFVPLANALTQIESARRNFIETVNGLDLSPEMLGKLSLVDDSLSKSEKDFNELLVDTACELRKQHLAKQT